MSKRTTVYISDKIQKIIGSYGEENSLSGVISTLVDRYNQLTQEAIPIFSEAEWSLICEDALKGCSVAQVSGDSDPAAMVWANIYDCKPEIGEKWGVNCKELADKIHSLPLSGRMAVWDLAARFWASPQRNKIETRKLLVGVGAKLK